MSDLDRLPPEIARRRVLDTELAATFCGQSVPNWRKLRADGKLPKAICLGGKKLGWRLGDLIDWLDKQTAA
ncbi:helix-turn-helix transcriptional regulator [Bosea sp. RAC05]|uniref:helix-turn-helix transcriptional regulator n=1 Tax=Bosea sp. RAC05 TaxID=1842539 RepID=UPI00083CE31D|nr:hypothetical protein [Bosea sp. RAC05]AOG06376.1 putative phage transcriptional regulator, AlpA [Bosea sp. RAC05]